MTDTEIINKCGDDANKWAQAFMDEWRKQGFQMVSLHVMQTWFASAIETACAVRRSKNESNF